MKAFNAVEEALKANRPKRFNRKTLKWKGKTLATC
jgi:hypothetical protein